VSVDGFARTYGVELLCAVSPTIEKPRLLAALRTRCPGVAPLDRNPQAGLLSFVHEDHPIQLKDARIAAQTFIAFSDTPVKAEALESSLQQSWSFQDARLAVSGATTTLLVTDFMSGSLEYHERIDLFQRSLLGVLSVVSCQAIHWLPSQRVVNPVAYVAASRKDPAQLFFAGALNVRIFNIANTQDHIVMDTLGLAALGLPDLQCHFHGLDTNRMATLLYNIGWYIFQQGDAIQDGHTVEGIEPGSKWRCQHETALVKPEREVLDLNPGAKHAAGSRS